MTIFWSKKFSPFWVADGSIVDTKEPVVWDLVQWINFTHILCYIKTHSRSLCNGLEPITSLQDRTLTHLNTALSVNKIYKEDISECKHSPNHNSMMLTCKHRISPFKFNVKCYCVEVYNRTEIRMLKNLKFWKQLSFSFIWSR